MDTETRLVRRRDLKGTRRVWPALLVPFVAGRA